MVLTHSRHGRRQEIRADVWFAIDENPVRRSVAGEGLDDLAHHGMIDPGGQLPVGVRARPALAEVHVALGVQGPVAHQLGDILAAGHDLAPALDEDALHPPLEQPIGTKEPGRPEAYPPKDRRFRRHVNGSSDLGHGFR